MDGILKKRILFFLHLPPPVHGASLVGCIIKDNFDLEGIYSKKYNSIGTTKYFSERRKFKLVKLFRFVNNYIKNIFQLFIFHPHLVYLTCSTHGLGFVKDSLYILICKILKIKVLLHFHNKGFHKKKLSYFGTLYHNFVLNNVKSIILSERIVSFYNPFIINSNVFFLGNGISDPHKEYMYRIKPEFRILVVSNLIVSKGIKESLLIISELKKQGFNLFLDIVGDEAEISFLELNKFCEELNIMELVKIHGPLYDKDKWAVFNEASIFLYPSFEDCFPLVLLEALSYGLPIISTNEGAICDIVDEGSNGFISDIRDTEKFVESIVKFYNHPQLLQEFSNNARMKFEDCFTEIHFIKGFTEIIKKCL